MANIAAVAVAVYAVLVVLGLCLGRAWARAQERADAMNRHPSARSRRKPAGVLPARYLPTKLGAAACCDECGWPLLSYEHYCECRR